jgi:hypothetical protein
MALINGSGSVAAAVLVPLPHRSAAAWPYLIASALLHPIYPPCSASRMSDFSQVYPCPRAVPAAGRLAPVVAGSSLDRGQLVALG